MIHNPVIDAMMNRKSIRKYEKRMPEDEVIETIILAGQQAPFAYQMGSVLMKKGGRLPFGAPLLFTICVDSHRHENVMSERGWKIRSNDLSLLLFGIQDAAYMAENMVVAAESLGLGSCFIGGAAYDTAKLRKQYNLPLRVFPMVHLVMGYPAENPPIRPRYPLESHLFEDQYPADNKERLERAMKVMNDGYSSQNYYKGGKLRIRLEDGKNDTVANDDYSWCEHISRKAGQWFPKLDEITEPLRECGFELKDND